MLQFLVNPVAGGGRAKRALPELERLIAAHQLEAQIQHTTYPGHATALVQTLPESDPLVVVGGDGTLHEVVRGLLDAQSRTERRVGIIPLGTGDDFARGVGIPVYNLAAALELILQNRTRCFDAARVGQRSFLNGFGVGFDAQVARTVKTTPTWLHGSLRYLLAIFEELRRLEAQPVRIYADDVLVHDSAALLVAVMNLVGYGGGLKINPHADGNDGLLEVVVGGRFSRLGTLGILPRLAHGKHLSHPEVKVYQAQKIRLEWQNTMPAHVDGELLEAGKIFQIEVLPKAISLFC
ncbi:MAG: diacylglycerol/lipid kinase family protein [Deinococcales bacterium]